MEPFFSPSSGEHQKKVFTKTGALFFPNSSGDLRSHTHQSQSIGLDADVDHTQIIGNGGYSQVIGGIYPPSPPGFSTPVIKSLGSEKF